MKKLQHLNLGQDWKKIACFLLLGGVFIFSGLMQHLQAEPPAGTQVPAKPLHVSSRSFGNMVLEAETPVLVDFWAPWCGPCLTMAPWLEELSEELHGRMRIVKLNVDENPALARRYRVMGLPTLVLFHGGLEVDRLIGLYTKKRIKGLLEARLQSQGF